MSISGVAHALLGVNLPLSACVDQRRVKAFAHECPELAEDVYAEADVTRPVNVCCAHWREGYEAAATEIARRIRERGGA